MKKILVFTLMMIISYQANAESITKDNPDKNQPIEITADNSLEWHRNDLQFIATGKVIAKQGETKINSEILTADYKDGEKNKIDIWRLTAAKNVKIESRNTIGYGDKMTYDVEKSVTIMTGKNLKLISQNQIVTASDSMEYWVEDGIFTANGNATAIKDDDTIKADKLIAKFTQDKNGKRILREMQAINNVTITTPTEIVTGDNGKYSAITNKAIITGNVKIKRGKNILQGDKAEIDMTTNISKIFGSSTDNGRVKGIFYPSEKK